MTRRVLSKIKVDRISAVDKPAQAPALVRILKRAQTPTELITMSTDLDRLTTACDDLIRKIDRALGDDPEEEGPPGLYDSLPSGDDGSAENEDEEEQDGANGYSMSVGKASNTDLISRNDTGNRPGALHSSSHGTGRHKFDALRDKIKHSRGVTASEAAHIAATEFPSVFADYQRHTAKNDTGSYFKRAPADFDSLVAAEIRKSGGYMHPHVAQQRVMQMWGSAAPRTTFAKGDDANMRFQKRVYDIADRDGCDLVTATQRARYENPNLVRAMNA
jgi:hypothetical protein